MTKSQEFIKKYAKRLSDGSSFFNPDTSLQPAENFSTAKVRYLLVVSGRYCERTLSATAAAINDYFVSHCPEVFFDVGYLPDPEDFALYAENDIPFAIGTTTHLDASHYDIVGFTIPVMADVVAAPIIMHTFSRCDNPIPEFWSDRKDAPFGKYPVFCVGGITATMGDSMFGTVPGKGTSFFDFAYLGDCGKTDIMIKRYIQARSGIVTRVDTDPDWLADPKVHTGVNDTCVVNTIQDYVDCLFDLSMIYQPQAYKVEFDDNLLIKSNTKVNPKAQDFVVPYYPHAFNDDIGMARSIIPSTGEGTGYAKSQISEGCSAAGACSFCIEGNYCGGWVEKPKAQVLNELREAKKYTAGYRYKPFSFNTNYYTDYKGMLEEFMLRYPKVTFVNMRMEELGKDTDALKIMRYIGSSHMQAPMEGFSPRCQNNLLNKCLSEESLNAFMEDMVHLGMVDIKVGMIYTGYEEAEDIQWLIDFAERYKEKANIEGGKFPFRVKCTGLVHYPLTPLEYLERKASKVCLKGEPWLDYSWYEEFKRVGIQFKFNGFKYSTVIEQCLADLGRYLTPYLYKRFIEPTAPVTSLRALTCDEFLDDLRGMIKNPDVFFGDRDIDKYISPCHRIHTELRGSYIPRARRLLRAKHNGNIFVNEQDIRCLKTFEGAKVKCYHNCIVDDPIVVYGDVHKDAEGNLEGDVLSKLLGCERCHTNEQRKDRLARPLPQTKDYDDIVSCPRIPQRQKIRFVLNRLPEYDLLNPNNTAHTFMTKFLQKSDILLDAYHSVNFHNMFWQSEPDIEYVASGVQIVDTIWTDDVISEVKRLIPEVNKELKSVQVVSAKEELMEEKISPEDYNIWYFETSMKLGQFESAVHNYRGEIKLVTGAVMSDAYTTLIQDKMLSAPVFASRGSKVVGYFALPSKYNPGNFLGCFLTGGARSIVNQVYQTSDFQCVGVYRESSAIDNNNPKERALISIATGKTMPLGKTNLCKALLTMKIKGK